MNIYFLGYPNRRRNEKNKVIIYNRCKRSTEEEIVFARKFMDFACSTFLGKFLTEIIFKRKFFSKIYSINKHRKKCKNKIMSFISKHNIDISDIEKDISKYESFNDFFIRKLKKTARPINKNKNILVSPADARLLAYRIIEDTIIPVKGVKYSLFDLIQDDKLLKKYMNGICLIFRLSPVDYHRFCYVDNGVTISFKRIGGNLYSVNPISLMANFPVFKENERHVSLLRTENFGEVIHIDVGAMTVGKIVQINKNCCNFKKGEEKGYFEFGASSIILLFEKNKLVIDHDICKYSKEGIETFVRYGTAIGKTKMENSGKLEEV